MLLAGKIDFLMGANTLQTFDAVAQNVPTIAVAAMFRVYVRDQVLPQVRSRVRSIFVAATR